MPLSPEEIERYARHIVLRDIGGPGQAKLKRARVLVIGAGGLGCPLVLYLAAAGVGVIGVADDDRVSLSNLQRQVLFATGDIGAPKAAAAARAVARLNPHVHVVVHDARIDATNAAALVSDYDIVADGSDNAATRLVVADACDSARKPLVTGAVGAMDGSITTLKPYGTGADGVRNPTYRSLFPDLPAQGELPACAETGILGALAGMIGALMAAEVIREIVGFGEGLVGRLLLVDLAGMRFETVRYTR